MSNRLARESSPYLLQHADNPVDWFPWSQEALQLAREQDKPIFLSIGYSACHWCHVMAHESFESHETAAIFQLRLDFGWHISGCTCDKDPVERRLFRPTMVAIATKYGHVFIPELLQSLLCVLSELGNPLDRIDLCAELGENCGLVP